MTYHWSVVSGDNALPQENNGEEEEEEDLLVELNGYLAGIQGDRVTIPVSLIASSGLLSGKVYTFVLQAENYFGKSSTAYWKVYIISLLTYHSIYC